MTAFLLIAIKQKFVGTYDVNHNNEIIVSYVIQFKIWKFTCWVFL